MEKSILKSISQLFLIVFSVVLGIFLSERIEERKNEKEAALLLAQIVSEVNDNKELVAYWAPYHRAIMNDLDSLSNSDQFIRNFIADKSALFEQVLTRGTLMGRFPSNDAWDIAKSHPLIVHFDYEDLLILSKVYNQQASAYNSVPKIIELLLSSDFNAPENAKQRLQMFSNQMREVASREEQLMEYFKEAEETLELQND